MKTVSLNLTAGQSLDFNSVGNYFHLLESTAGVDISFLLHGQEASRAQNMEFGFFAKPAGGFTGLRFESATTQTIKIALGFGDGGYNRTTGSVQIVGQANDFSQSQKTVTNASGLLLAANPSRKLLFIQNNDAAGIIYVALDGSPATTASGIKILQGGSLILDSHLPSGAVYAIGDIAGNVNVVVVES